MEIFQLIMALIIFAVLGTFVLAGFRGAPWVPTKKRERARLIELLKSQQVISNKLESDAIVYDLGCGNGAILFDISNEYPEITVRGVELSLLPYTLGKFRLATQAKRYPNISIKFGNLYSTDISDADIVFIYLLPGVYEKVLEYLRTQEFRDKTTVIIEGWPLPEKRFYFKNDEEGLLPLYFYKGEQFNN